jgi:hypothetical protein
VASSASATPTTYRSRSCATAVCPYGEQRHVTGRSELLLDAKRFTGLLSTAEIAIGAALVVPVVPAWLAGAGLTAFALGTLGLYLRTPGMREEGSLRPTQQGIPLAKDAWMVGIGLALMIDELAGRASQS